MSSPLSPGRLSEFTAAVSHRPDLCPPSTAPTCLMTLPMQRTLYLESPGGGGAAGVAAPRRSAFILLCFVLFDIVIAYLNLVTLT